MTLTTTRSFARSASVRPGVAVRAAPGTCLAQFAGEMSCRTGELRRQVPGFSTLSLPAAYTVGSTRYFDFSRSAR